MNNFIAGKREALGSNSSKYGYSTDGMCVKAVGGGYRSLNGTMINTAVSTDASCLVKEAIYLNTVKVGQVIVFDRAVCKVMSVSEINPTTAQFKLLNLETGVIDEQIVDTADRIVSVIWDTFENPDKTIAGGIAAISMNEFTPAQLYALKKGTTTIEELRKPVQSETLEDVLSKIVKNIIKAGTDEVAQG
jgi:hypothetical protein